MVGVAMQIVYPPQRQADAEDHADCQIGDSADGADCRHGIPHSRAAQSKWPTWADAGKNDWQLVVSQSELVAQERIGASQTARR
jgi:hypothetical protein